MKPSKAALIEILAPHGQEHVLAFWDELSQSEREELAAQVCSLDLDLLGQLIHEGETPTADVGDLEPAGYIRLPGDDSSEAQWCAAAEAGEEALSAGRIAAMVVAGGQGTRLGFDGPKGAFPIGPVTDRTLFQIHVEKVMAASRRHDTAIPLLVMTSPSNDAATKAFFEENGFFGMPEEDIRIFSQGEMPAVGDDGRLLMAARSEIFTSPNGHGGALKALWDSKTVEWLESRGIDVISYFQVDNPLVRVIDESYIGFHVLGGADVALKLLTRTISHEKLGIWLSVEGKPRIIEYSDMTAEDMAARDADGTLRYKGGSIAIHCFSVPFVRRLSERGFMLPYHRARKKVPHLTPDGSEVEPTEPNATKFEMFIFDALNFAERPVAVETSREAEFSPVKNASGTDSPETARRDLSRAYAVWLEGAGVSVPRGEDGYPLHPIEISPLFADGPEALSRRYSGPRSVDGPLVLDDDERK